MEANGNVTHAQTETLQEILSSPEILDLARQLKKSAPALTHAVQRVDTLVCCGALDTFSDMVEVVHALSVTMTDGMVGRLADRGRVLMELTDLLMASQLVDKAPAMMRAVREAGAAAAADKSFVGPIDALMAPREPELQYLIRFLLALARRLPGVMQEK